VAGGICYTPSMVTPLTESHWPATTDGPPLRDDLTVGQLLREVAAETPDRIALVEGTFDPASRRRWTYAELLADAERCARALLRRFEPGERVAIWAHNLPEWLIVEYGAALAGIVLVTVNPSYQPGELAYVLGQSRSAGILLVPEVRGNALQAHLEAVRAELPELREVLRLDQLSDLLAEANPGGPASALELPAVAANDPVQIQYTSGTTGFPKGALLRHRGVANNAAIWADRVGVPDGSSWLSPMPMFHTGGCVLAALGALSRRATLVLMVGFDPGLMLELIEAERVWFAAGVPTMLIAMMDHPEFAARDLSSLTGVLSGGAQVPEALVRRIESTLGVDFTIVYGQTECSPAITNTFPSDSPEDKGLTVGPPLPHTEVRIVEPSTLGTVPVGVSGELWTRGYHTMLQYFDNPEATDETLLPDGWLRTGDLATMDERGYCRIVGRLKDMIIRGGENLFPAEIEEALYRHPSVAEVAVVGLPDETWGEIVAAFVRPVDPGAPPAPEELRSHLRSMLSPQKTPTVWVTVESFPLTGSGKIQKFALRDAYLAGRFSPAPPTA
jgi:fatty-acyl-CoA synthase